jgi:hypothetical protein
LTNAEIIRHFLLEDIPSEPSDTEADCDEIAVGGGTNFCLVESVSPTTNSLREASRYPPSVPGLGLCPDLLEFYGMRRNLRRSFIC